MSDVLNVVVTGAAGQIAYSLLYSVAKGDVFGPTQPINLTLVDIGSMMTVIQGVQMELQDCALPLLKCVKAVAASELEEAFKDADIAVLVGAMPRKEGMERKDLLKANVNIFKQQGAALNQFAKKTCKVLVVGNPANTNAFICKKYAPSIPPENFSALTRLDQNRAQAQISARLNSLKGTNTSPLDIHNVTIWGNHSSTQFPDACHAIVNLQGKLVPVYEAVQDEHWLKHEFLDTVQKRGAQVIQARKLSSAMSAAKAICDHLRDWWFGTKEGQWVSMAVASDGSYDIEQGLIYSFPVMIGADHSWKIVQNLAIDDFAREKMALTETELKDEKNSATEFCQD